MNGTIEQKAPAPVMDVMAMLKESLAGLDGDSGQSAADAGQDAQEAPGTGSDGADDLQETDEAGTAEDGADETTDDEDEAEDNTEEVKDPAALLKAHMDMKAKLQKRTEKLKALESEVAALKATQSESDGSGSPVLVLAPTERHPLANVRTADELTQAQDYWKQELQWCAKNSDGGFRQLDGKEVEWDSEAVSRRRDLAVNVLTKHLPDRKAFLDEYKSSAQQAMGKYPFLAENHTLHKEADAYARELMERVPEMSQHPNWIQKVSEGFIGKLVASGKYAVTPDKTGKLTIVPLRADQPGNPKPKTAKDAVKSPPSQVRAAAPPAKQAAGRDAGFEAAMSANDFTGAIKAWLD